MSIKKAAMQQLQVDILAYINGVWYDDNQNLIAPDLYIVQKVAYAYEYCGE